MQKKNNVWAVGQTAQKFSGWVHLCAVPETATLQASDPAVTHARDTLELGEVPYPSS